MENLNIFENLIKSYIGNNRHFTLRSYTQYEAIIVEIQKITEEKTTYPQFLKEKQKSIGVLYAGFFNQ